MISNKIHVFNYKIDDDHRKELYNSLVRLHHTHDYGSLNNNMEINGEFPNEIKSFFVNKCSEVYGNFTILDDPRSTAWAYMINKDWYRGEFVHDHMSSCTYVGVYYLNVPKCEDKYEGCLKLYNYGLHNYGRDVVVCDYFFPKNDQLIIFESDLIHSITQSKTEEFRISINLELRVAKKIEFEYH